MNRTIKLVLLEMIFIISNTFPQSFKLVLDNISMLDDYGAHVVILKDKPNEKLIIHNGISEPKFINLFYSWDSNNDENISILVTQSKSSDLLYIDLNNDEDLTNDGLPKDFPFSRDSIWIEISDNIDVDQKTRFALYRANPSDSSQILFIDDNGNLLPKIAKMYGTMNGLPEYTGEKGTFYFEYRLGVKRGIFKTADLNIQLGLFDYSNNGLFNDDKDVFLIDLNQDNKLDYNHDEEIFKLDDIFRIINKKYKLTNINKYGNNLTLTETTENPTKYFSRWNNEKKYNENEYKLEQDFWDYTFTDLDEKKILMQKYKGKYLLLNFWGEWCKPCRDELPILINESKKNHSVEIISFLKTYNKEKAKELIKTSMINWPNILLPEEIENKFKIRGYPTNYLIYPDGKTYIKQGQINEDFFDSYVK